MNNIVTQRFVKCLKQLKTDKVVRSMRQFALSVDYLPQSLSEILKERRDVTIELLRKSVAEYKFNPFYIFTGEGPLFMTEEDNQNYRVLTVVTNAGNDEKIVHVPDAAHAGYANQSDNPVFVQELPTFSLPDDKYRNSTHRSFGIAGDGMEPTLFEGDKVVCNFLDPTLWETEIKDNYVYVIVTKADVLIKRVNNHLKEDKELLLLSDNTFYQPYRIGLGEIKELWYVRAKISPFLPSPQNISNIIRDEMLEMRKVMGDQSRMIQDLQLMINRMNERI